MAPPLADGSHLTAESNKSHPGLSCFLACHNCLRTDTGVPGCRGKKLLSDVRVGNFIKNNLSSLQALHSVLAAMWRLDVDKTCN